MELGNEHLLIHFAWLAPAVAATMWFGRIRRRKRLAMIAPGEGQRKMLTASVSAPRRAVQTIFLLLTVVFTFAALLRPLLGVETVGRPVTGRDVFVVLDVSRSMLAHDAKPSRLAAAKAFAEDLVDALPGDRFGLMAFAGKPQLMCPITANRLGFRMVLGNTDTRSVPRGGTDLEEALKRTLSAFKGAEAEYRAVVLLSDGEELGGDVKGIVGELRKRGIMVHAVGFGDADIGSLIQLQDLSFVMENGKRVRTRLNEETLRTIAEAGGGLYVHSTLQMPGIEHIAGEIRKLDSHEVGVIKSVRPIERYQVPLSLAVLCLLMFFLIGERTSRPITAPVAVLMLMACTVQAAAPIKNDIRTRRFKQQIQDEKDPVEKVRLTYNLARHFQELNDHSRAEVLYDEILQDRHTSRQLRAAVYQNLGAIRHKAGDAAMKKHPTVAISRYREAILHYEESLRLKTNDDVAHNLALARRQLKAAQERAKKRREKEQQKKNAVDIVRKALRQQEQANAKFNAEDWQKKQEEAQATTKQAEKPLGKLGNNNATAALKAALTSQKTTLETESEEKRRSACVQAAAHLRETLKVLGVLGSDQPKSAGNRPKSKGSPKIDPENDPEIKTPAEAAMALLRQAEREERELGEKMNEKKNMRYYKKHERDW